ncbi:Imm74 family immunity protein [Methylocystis heyeri]|jgi:hypothetical protein|uniref:Immunity protein 74 n=1 Tax=Methylocystis heyeri TaxID=391905 RepID=A0A6B8KIS7_9HYPH|nr:Imm74 family immunity protein [Methylocystis heyeri]QGM46430.1 hypothetical protein H2LOC_012400 [Methylocystis heyeri]
MARRGVGVEVEITEGAIRVRSAGRVLTIANAPPPPDVEEDIDFYVLLDEIAHWDAPDDDQEIEVAELQKILEAIERQVEKHGLNIVFE